MEVAKHPVFDHSTCKYLYGNTIIMQYWSVRLLIVDSDQCSLTLNRIVFDEDNKIVRRVICIGLALQ